MKIFLKRLLVVLVVIALFSLTPTFQWFKSIAVMSVYSTYEASYSLLKDQGIKVKIPGGAGTLKDDWYPFVITFQDDRGFSRYIKEEARMTVLYNFGHFSPLSPRSLYYEPESPYYNSFYGAYAVSLESGQAFGFEDGTADIEVMSQVPIYDMKYLVLWSIGCEEPVMDFQVIEEGHKKILDGEDWYYFDASMTVSGAIHEYKEDERAYIQYGRPPLEVVGYEDYQEVDMYGRIYAKHLEAQGVTLFFYCIATDLSVVEEWEVEQMAKTKVSYD